MNISNSMQRQQNYNQMLQSKSPSLGKRINIIKAKYPSDFFGSNQRKVLGALNKPHRPINCFTEGRSRSQVDNKVYRESKTIGLTTSRNQIIRNTNTANPESASHELDLIMGIISTNREIQKAFRKYSTELKNDKAQRKIIGLDLPPLIIKKNININYC